MLCSPLPYQEVLFICNRARLQAQHKGILAVVVHRYKENEGQSTGYWKTVALLPEQEENGEGARLALSQTTARLTKKRTEALSLSSPRSWENPKEAF